MLYSQFIYQYKLRKEETKKAIEMLNNNKAPARVR